jgi:hypothetical protein
MVFASWIECISTTGAFAVTLHVLVYREHMFASPTKHCSFISSITRPDVRLVCLAGIVAADASVEFVAAKVFNGDNVEG